MNNLFTSILAKFSILSIVLGMGLSSGLSAYQQGSFFLFDIREDAAESSATGRIAVAKAVFKKKATVPAAQLAQKDTKKSEFESDFTVFESKDKGTKSSIFQLQDSTGSGNGTESAFGETTELPSGFYFTY